MTPPPPRRLALGLDFGTECARALLVDLGTGQTAATAVRPYPHGVLTSHLPNHDSPLPRDYALQHPQDWLDCATAATREALAAAGASADDVTGVGVAFTSCTMLPCRADGTPLCLLDRFASTPLAWPKLWKHHAATAAADRINQVARDRREPWLDRYGGAVGLEWFFPKLLETLAQAPDVYAAADVWLEAGDWLVWQLTAGPHPRCDAADLVRSTCQAGYKGLWSPDTGFPSADFLRDCHPGLADAVTYKMPGRLLPPGRAAGALSSAAAALLGLRAGTPVSAAIIDAHAGVPGAGVAEPGTLVLVLGTSACHMLMADDERLVPGVAGVVRDGILPGYFGYETGQASVGDAFAWLARTLDLSHDTLAARAAAVPPGSGGVLAVDWLGGCRTPLMDNRLSGAFVGVRLDTTPAQLYRALIESTAFGVRAIVETLRAADLPVRQFVASGGLPVKSPLLMQVCADVLDHPIRLAASPQSVALGAAILGALAAEPNPSPGRVRDVVHHCARTAADVTYHPRAEAARAYDEVYALYRGITHPDGPAVQIMRRLDALRHPSA
jgi:L-ribulokinase